MINLSWNFSDHLWLSIYLTVDNFFSHAWHYTPYCNLLLLKFKYLTVLIIVSNITAVTIIRQRVAVEFDQILKLQIEYLSGYSTADARIIQNILLDKKMYFIVNI